MRNSSSRPQEYQEDQGTTRACWVSRHRAPAMPDSLKSVSFTNPDATQARLVRCRKLAASRAQNTATGVSNPRLAHEFAQKQARPPPRVLSKRQARRLHNGRKEELEDQVEALEEDNERLRHRLKFRNVFAQRRRIEELLARTQALTQENLHLRERVDNLDRFGKGESAIEITPAPPPCEQEGVPVYIECSDAALSSSSSTLLECFPCKRQVDECAFCGETMDNLLPRARMEPSDVTLPRSHGGRDISQMGGTEPFAIGFRCPPLSSSAGELERITSREHLESPSERNQSCWNGMGEPTAYANNDTGTTSSRTGRNAESTRYRRCSRSLCFSSRGGIESSDASMSPGREQYQRSTVIEFLARDFRPG